MNKWEYLEKLDELLNELPEEDREDILSDYEEHFQIGLENGRTEEELSRALGDPKTVAKQIKAEYMITKAEDKPSAGSMLEAVLAAAGLGLFNMIFVAVPAMGFAAIMVALFVVGLAVVFTGILAIFSPLLNVIFPNYIHLPVSKGIFGTLIMIGGGMGLTVLGTVWVVIMAYVSKWFYDLAIRYLKLNLRIIKGREASNS
ncbi:HAAS signaling domain-containing protein [Methanobacterium aggregans]|uniref:HAAS signaling domain-containing protein n=1 Tax=Methanobacterium aggregans TaxID=1615586 RepID=UPI001AE2ABFC|nr:DUF1700 domain-containing protein [Methanobacterium aggregans]MBP2045809.1 putative membrane protein [Methanobacterium aggregans]